VKLASKKIILNPGEPVVLNVNQNAEEVAAGSGPVMDIPSLDFNIENTLIFYERKYPTIQSVEVVDMTGYNSRFKSDLIEVPTARAFYEKYVLNLNSWDPSTQVIESPEDPILGDLDSGSTQSATHTFSESLKIFYKVQTRLTLSFHLLTLIPNLETALYIVTFITIILLSSYNTVQLSEGRSRVWRSGVVLQPLIFSLCAFRIIAAGRLKNVPVAILLVQ